MTMDTRTAREREAMRRQTATHLEPEQEPDARGMGAESAEYTKPTIDPQWISAWKMFVDDDGNEYGVPVKIPRNQWDQGGPNALMNLRRPDGGYWFTLVEPERKMADPQYECFVRGCKKRLHERSMLIDHVKAFHYSEAERYKDILKKIEEKVAQEDPRLQRLLVDLDAPVVSEEIEPVVTCDKCGSQSPFGHESPDGWLRGHKMGAHKEGS